jgi:hypothetical protein
MNKKINQKKIKSIFYQHKEEILFKISLKILKINSHNNYKVN